MTNRRDRRRQGRVILVGVLVLASSLPIASAETEPPFTTATPTGTAGSNGWFQSTVTVQFTAIDNGSGVHQTFRRIGANAFAAGGSLAVTAEGTSVVEYYSTDLDGNVESTRSLTVRVDTRNPRALLSPNPPPGGVIDPSSPTVRRYSADVSLGASHQDFPGGSGVHNRSYYLVKDGVNGPWTAYGSPVLVTEEGEYSFVPITFDVAGRQGGLSAPFQFVIDKTAPTLSIRSVPGPSAGAVALRLTPSEPLGASPAPTMDLTGPGCAPCTVTFVKTAALAWTATFSPSMEASYTYDAVAYDLTGNMATLSGSLEAAPTGLADLAITPAPGSILAAAPTAVAATFETPVVARSALLDGVSSLLSASPASTSASAGLGHHGAGYHVAGLSVDAGPHERTVTTNYLVSPETPSLSGLGIPGSVPAGAIVRAYVNASVAGAGLASVTIANVPARWVADTLWTADVGPFAEGAAVDFDAMATTLAGVASTLDGPVRNVGPAGSGATAGVRAGSLAWDGRHLKVLAASGPTGAGSLDARALVGASGAAPTWVTGTAAVNASATDVAFDFGALPGGLLRVHALWINDTAASLASKLAPVTVPRAASRAPSLVDFTVPATATEGPIRITANLSGADRARLVWNLTEPLLAAPAHPRTTEPTSVTRTGDVLSLAFDFSHRPGIVWARLEAFDVRGGRLLSPASVSLVSDGLAPTLSSLSPADGSSVSSKRPSIAMGWSDPSGMDLTTANVQVNGQKVSAPALALTSSGFSYAPTADLDGTVTVDVSVKDALGNTAARIWTFTAGAVSSGSTTNLGLPAPCAAQDQVGTGSEVTCPGSSGGSDGTANATGGPFDTTPPEIIAHGPVGLVRDAAPALTLRYRDAAAIPAQGVVVDLDGRRLAVQAGADSATAALGALAPGLHRLEAAVDDARGNRARVAWSFWYAPPGAAYDAQGGRLTIPGVGLLDPLGAKNATLVAEARDGAIHLSGFADGGLASVRIVEPEGYLVAAGPVVAGSDLALPARIEALDAGESAPKLAFASVPIPLSGPLRVTATGYGLTPLSVRLALADVPANWPADATVELVARNATVATYEVSVPALPDGAWNAIASVRDAWGREAFANATFAWDGTGPTASVAYKPGSATVDVSARDAGTGVKSIRLVVDGRERAKRTFEATDAEARVLNVPLDVPLPAGNHSFVVETEDFHGNTGRFEAFVEVPAAESDARQRIPESPAFALLALVGAALVLLRRRSGDR